MNPKLSLALVVALSTSAAAAQGHGGPPPGGGRGPMGGGSGGSPSRSYMSPDASRTGSSLQIGPAGRWWDESGYVQSLGLTNVQQHRMDQVFSVNRPALIKLLTNLKQAEAQLDQVKRAGTVNENALFAQIDRVSQARGELAKANAHLLLQIRKELTPEQTAKLDEQRP